MPTERIDIVVSERGARVVRRNLEDIGGGAERAEGGVQLLKRALGALVSAAAITQLGRLLDSFTNIQNRLRNVTRNTAELNVVTDELFAISNRTRSSFESTAEVYARTALATKDLGISQQDTLQFTESLNQAVILSGASAQEANAALIQLSQGLASGTLRGDELRSVLEQLPAVADVIAEGLGVTRGELRKLGEEGKITARDIIGSFEDAREELAERFGKTVPTIGQAFQVLRNRFLQFIGNLDESLGITRTFAQLIISLSENMDTLGRIAGTVGGILATVFVGRGIKAAIAGVRSLTAVIAANPLGALAILIISVVSALVSFSDQISVTEGGLANLQDFALAVWESIGEGLDFLQGIFESVFGFLTSTFEETFEGIDFSFAGLLTAVAEGIDFIIGGFRGAGRAVIAAFDDVPASLELLFVETFNTISRAASEFVNSIVDVLNPILDLVGLGTIGQVGVFELQLSEAARRAGENIGAAFRSGFEDTSFAQDFLAGRRARAEEIAQDRLRREQERAAELERARAALGQAGVDRTPQPGTQEFQNVLDDLKNQRDALKLLGDEQRIQLEILSIEDSLKRSLNDEERERVTLLLQEIDALQLQSDVFDEIVGPVRDYERRLEALNGLLDRGAISQATFTEEVRRARLELLATDRSLQGGIQRGLLIIQEEFGTLGDLASRTLVDAFQSAEDALVEFVTTGKLSFSDLVNSIFADLARLAIRQSITGPLANLLGLNAGNAQTGGAGGLGGLFTALGGLLGFQDGGSIMVGGRGGVDRNVLSLNGEPVARVSRGETISVSPEGGGRTTVINAPITVVTPDVAGFDRNSGQIAAQVARQLQRANQRNN